MSEPIVTVEQRGEVAVIRFDDGKANVISPASVAALDSAFDRAERDASSVVLIGRPGRFSAGFDLAVVGGGDADASSAMMRSGAELAVRIYEFPIPVVFACTGHAIAMGAVLLLCADTRIGVEGDFRIGLNEVAIGMSLPTFVTELAIDRLSRRHLQQATGLAEIYSPAGAIDAGFLDRVVAPESLLETAVAEAERGQALDRAAHTATKRRLRGATVQRIRASLDEL